MHGRILEASCSLLSGTFDRERARPAGHLTDGPLDPIPDALGLLPANKCFDDLVRSSMKFTGGDFGVVFDVEDRIRPRPEGS